MSLPESLERAATRLNPLADKIRPANGDPDKLLEDLAPQEAREVLAFVLADDIDGAKELVDAWGEWEKGAEVLLGVTDEALREQGISKQGRKTLRRAHHRLRSRGIEVDAPAAPTLSRIKNVVVDDTFDAAYLSSPDFRGARVGYLADRHPAGGARLFEIRFDEGRGILDFKVYNAGRSKVRGFLRSLSSAQAQRLFDVPRSALCALVRRASQGQPPERPLPSSYVEWRGRLFSEAVEKEATPGGLARSAIEEAQETGATEAAIDFVVEMIQEGDLGPWPPPTSWVSERMDEARESVGELEGVARESAIEAWRASTTLTLAEKTDADLLGRHIEESAWVAWQVDGLLAAANLLAAADAVRADSGAQQKIAQARVDSLFAPLLGELRLGPEAAAGEPAPSTD